ncbi:actin cytoskeleton and mitosis protein [Mucor velutinosus]|uniref:Actin cytoskeleton and mitosis protein n=1 Tax=Mucor velutinosus TaxID=708070 RepID=A0AAN7DHM8_9FUNG|nr:actin cytoskeleton and mitosis protein [Mucor velutinosus]
MLGPTIHNKTILEEEEEEEEQEQDMDNDDHILNYLTDATVHDNIRYYQDITRLLRHNNNRAPGEAEPMNGDDDHYLYTSSTSVDLSPNSSYSKARREQQGGVYASASCVDADSIVDADFDANYASLDDTTAAFQHQQQQFGINSLLPCSSSSLNMYHHQHRRLPSTSTSTCSSYTSRMMLLDEDILSSAMTAATSNASTATSNAHHDTSDSILMKQALKQAQQRKRRESIGEVVTIRKRPASTSVVPRLTKSSVLQTNSTINSASSNRKRSLSNIHHNNNRRKYYSLQQPLSQSERNKLASLEPSLSSSSITHSTFAAAGGGGVHWDPHIDAFEILRAKITGITRSMQEFHVQELFHDEIMGQKRRQMVRPSRTISSPIITTEHRSSNNKRELKGRRFSMANLNENNSLYLGHRRIKSQSFLPSDKDEDEEDDNKQEDETLTRSLNHYRMHQDHSSYNYSEEEEEEEEDELSERQLKSPNLTALFTTTNSLINSRLDELSETASIKSNTSQLEWQKQFLSLVTSCIHQSEALESLSTDVLNAEHRVRELMLVNDTLHEQFHEREKQYEERIRECQQVAHQQLVMIDSLEELTADINMKMESRRREMHRQEALRALDANNTLQDQELELQHQQNERWNFQRSVADLLNMADKHDVIQKMRWDVGMFVGGGVGTGHVIHSYQDKLNGIDMMIAGTGTTTMPYRGGDIQYSDQEEEEEEEEEQAQTTTFSISPSIHHIRLYQHQYILHLSNRDRQTRFSLLPKCLWVPDHETNQCQFQHTKRHLRCSTRFSFFQRKHHCRRCGSIVCQRHSANRLPLFNTSKAHSTTGQWSRVCDGCFYDLIMHK